MYGTLPAVKRLAASVALSAVVCSAIAIPARSLAFVSVPEIDAKALAGGDTRVETVTFEAGQAPLEIAHHGGEGGSATVGAALGSSHVLTNLSAHVQKSTWSDSLWGNLLLSMAYQRDPEIMRLAKKLGRVNTLTLLSVAGVSGLGLAQSIVAYNDIKPQSIDVTEAHHAGGEDHVHIPASSKAPATMGIIGSSATIATLGLRAILNKRYCGRLEKRQLVIRQQVEDLLSRLDADGQTPGVEQELAGLVGPRASREFIQLWQASQPVQ